MAIKKKVTYSVSYTAGTDTLSTKLNSILSDIVGLILSHNSGLSILDTITYGSERMTGAPLYNTRPSNLYSDDYNNRFYESDLIFIGTNEDNVCLSLGFFDGELVIAMNMTPKVEKSITDVWSSRYGMSTLAFYATGKASRYFKRNYNYANYAIPYRIVNNTISLSVIYWTGDYSSGYSITNTSGETDGINLVIFQTNEGNNTTGIGGAIQTWSFIDTYHSYNKGKILTWSFSENLIDNPPSVLNITSGGMTTISTSEALIVNGQFDWRAWFNTTNNATYSVYNPMFAHYHSLGASTGNCGQGEPDSMPIVYQVNEGYYPPVTTQHPQTTNKNGAFVSIAMSAYNLPHLESGQAYVRKMRIPGWNPNCKGEIYLLWTPSLSAYQSGDIVEIGNKQYAIITEGVVCWAARVS